MKLLSNYLAIVFHKFRLTDESFSSENLTNLNLFFYLICQRYTAIENFHRDISSASTSQSKYADARETNDGKAPPEVTGSVCRMYTILDLLSLDVYANCVYIDMYI